VNTATPSPRLSDKTFYVVNGVLSAAALAFLTYILVLRGGSPESGADLRFMPAVNAALNATASALIVAGYVFIKKKRPDLHRLSMAFAFFASALFLVGYLVYHYVHGDTKYPADAPLRGLYLFVLASHVLLSVAVVPLVLTSFFFALTKQFAKHKRVTKYTLPIWLYVSVTGVAIFFMLRSALG
jgi:putative membrane protein